MKRQKFTPEQKEQILSAVNELIVNPDSSYYISRFVSDLCAHRLLQLTNENNEAAFTKDGYVIDNVQFDEISEFNLKLSDFFFQLHEAINNRIQE